MTSADNPSEASVRRFRVLAENDLGNRNEVWATCADVEGFFTCPDDPEGRRFIGLLDAAVSGPLLEYCAGRGRGDKVHSNAYLQILDLADEVIGEYFMTVLCCYDSARRGGEASNGERNDADGRYDVTLDIIAAGKPSAVKEIWQRWSDDLPKAKNLWAAYSSEGRRAWLNVVRVHHRRGIPPDAPPGTTFEIDGGHVTDEAAFYCAMGEAINGPGGYFGGDLNALADCLCGDYGATIPFTLLWRDFNIAAQHLNKPIYGNDSLCGEPPPDYYDVPEGEELGMDSYDPPDPNMTRSYLDRIFEVLQKKGVTVIRA
jgi:RNAse (barnase) inhibitor barstar